MCFLQIEMKYLNQQLFLLHKTYGSFKVFPNSVTIAK